VAEALNLRPARAPTRVADVLIVGAGPAGLGAAVYAASEGLSAVLVDSTAPPAGSPQTRCSCSSAPTHARDG
jgi:thioredoxin reductase (NADPH)